SATTSSASSRRKKRSVRQSFPSSTQARARFRWCSLSLASKRSNKVKASAVPPAKPAITLPSPRRRTFLAVAFITVFSRVTCPSPTITVLPSRRTHRMVVPCNIRLGLTGWLSRSKSVGMRSVVDALQLLPADVRVALSGGEAGVAQELLDAAHIGTGSQKV